MRILYLTQWFDPEPGVIKGPAFVRGLEAGGHSVTVVTGLPNYPEGRIFPGYRFRLLQRETLAGVDIVRLPLYPSHSRSSFGRALNFVSFFLSILGYSLLRRGQCDLAYVYHPPITVGLAAAISGAVRRVPFVLEIQDLWPDTVVSSGMHGVGALGRILEKICNFVYRRARSIVVQSYGMRSLLIERGVPPEKVTVVRNWADEAALRDPGALNRRELGLGDAFTFLYAGNLGRAQGLESVIRAAKFAHDRGALFELFLIGDGIDADLLRAFAAEIDAANVRFLPRVPKAKAAAIMSAADVLVMHLADHAHLAFTIPSKTQFYLAMGRPILAGVSGEAAEILRDSGAAMLCRPNDVEGLAAAMIEMAGRDRNALLAAGQAGKAYYLRTLGFQSGMAVTLDVLARAVSR